MATKSRASRIADQAERDQGQQPEPEAKPTEPYAVVTTEPYPRTFLRPVVKVTLPDGEVVETVTECEHEAKYGHESEKAALICARHIAAQRGLTVRAPQS